MDRLPSTDATLRLQQTFAQQQAAFQRHAYPSIGERQSQLGQLKRQLQRYQDVLAAAMSQDFGYRPDTESLLLDLLPTILHINHTIQNLGRWMRPSRRHNEWVFATNRLYVRYQPKGVIGIIGTWNFPVYLALGPLVAALGAGNRAIIKMPENMPATTQCLRQMLAEIFPEDQVALFGGELHDPNRFTELPFDHIVFTGSTRVGRIVMQHAAQNLTPVTLELGGKSPAVVLRDYPIQDAATSIAHGKCVNAGQICVSPDYALVPADRLEAFVDSARQAAQSFYHGQFAGNPDYASLVSEAHAARIRALLDDARQQGATVIACGPLGDGRQIPLHIVTGCTPAMRLMQEELFGPILPVLTYERLEDAIAHIQSGPRPLALYCFSHDRLAREELLRQTHSGGVTINDWGRHVMSHDAPFGGIGASGMGSYHGEEGFRELSLARTVFVRHRFFPVHWFQPPYGNRIQRALLRWFLGRADPNVSPPPH